MAGGLLMRGTKTKSRQQIQDEMDRLKAQLNVGGGVTGAYASIETVAANLPGALRLAAEILRQPTFPESEFEPARQTRLAGLEAAKTEPQALGAAGVAAPFEAYPRGDMRYVGTFDEQIEDLKKVTLDDARKFYPSSTAAAMPNWSWWASSTRRLRPSWRPNCSAIGKVPATSSAYRTHTKR